MNWLAVLFFAQIALGQLKPAPPVPTWQPWMEHDERYKHQYVFLSEDRREIILRYTPEPDDRQRHMPEFDAGQARTPLVIRATIKNRVAPNLTVAISQRFGGYFLYRYTVRNLNSARDPIYLFGLVVPDGLERPPVTHGRWLGPSMEFGRPTTVQLLAAGTPPARSLLWFPNSDVGGSVVAPGGAEDGFLVESNYKPGYTTADMADSWERIVDWPETDAPWPNAVSTQLDPLLRWVRLGNKFPTVGPAFPPDESLQTIALRIGEALDKLAGVKPFGSRSPFLLAARDLLNRIAREGAGDSALISVAPSNYRERELAQVLRLSLNVTVPKSAR